MNWDQQRVHVGTAQCTRPRASPSSPTRRRSQGSKLRTTRRRADCDINDQGPQGRSMRLGRPGSPLFRDPSRPGVKGRRRRPGGTDDGPRKTRGQVRRRLRSDSGAAAVSRWQHTGADGGGASGSERDITEEEERDEVRGNIPDRNLR